MHKPTRGMTSKPAISNNKDEDIEYKKGNSLVDGSDASCINNGKKGRYTVSLSDTSDIYPNREDID